MTVIRALVSIPNGATGLARDACVNTFHFGSTAPATTAPSAHTALTAFYQAVDTHYSSVVGSPATVKYYDLAEPEPRVPFLTSTIALSVGSGVALPNECAAVTSFRGDIVSGGNQARRRGRIFFGPLDGDTISVVAGDQRLNSTIIANLNAAAKALAEATISSSIGWVVFSPTTAGAPPWSEGTLDASSVPVTAGWTDNAVDIVRSRGLAPTVRTSWVAV